MAFFAAYLEESGNDGQSPVLVVAGLVPTVEQWVAFEDEWNGLLVQYGITRLHMMDLHATKGEFKGWKISKKTEFMKAATTIIHDCAPGLIYSAVNLKEFNQAKKRAGHPNLSAYQFCCDQCLGALQTVIKNLPARAVVQVLFEQGNKVTSEIFKLFNEASKWAWMLRDIGIAHVGVGAKQLIVQFQGADLAVFLIRRHFAEHGNNYFKNASDWLDLLLAKCVVLGQLNSGITLDECFQALRETANIKKGRK